MGELFLYYQGGHSYIDKSFITKLLKMNVKMRGKSWLRRKKDIERFRKWRCARQPLTLKLLISINLNYGLHCQCLSYPDHHN